MAVAAPAPAEVSLPVAAAMAAVSSSPLHGVAESSPYEPAELEQMLRNFRLRKRLDVLPGAGVPFDPYELRWIQEAWRDAGEVAQLRAEAEEGRAAAGEAERGSGARGGAEAMAEVAEMQQRLERGYGALNAERRSRVALAEGLRRQRESLAAIRSESALLRGQLGGLRAEAQQRVVENGALGRRLGLHRQSQARGLTQAAVLATALERVRKASDPRGGSAVQALAACRAQIAALVEDNAALSRSLARRSRASPGGPPGEPEPGALPP
ncbi:unnamed protein product [Prorocentrum cordatum]|uniref:Cilia- and flagella-associated protein 157 n=1 Tax=Prorocentrum cordatum TaxID=2364126 RepID=A0ABN9U749_9DINO|nr:unnamed protein product [Polarella glacialis]